MPALPLLALLVADHHKQRSQSRSIYHIPAATGGSETETFMEWFVGFRGAGVLYWYGAISPTIAVSNGVTPSLTIATANYWHMRFFMKDADCSRIRFPNIEVAIGDFHKRTSLCQ